VRSPTGVEGSIHNATLHALILAGIERRGAAAGGLSKRSQPDQFSNSAPVLGSRSEGEWTGAESTRDWGILSNYVRPQ